MSVQFNMDDFEMAIIKFGIDAACEWFGYERNDEFTIDTHKVLRERHPAIFAVEQGAGEHISQQPQPVICQFFGADCGFMRVNKYCLGKNNCSVYSPVKQQAVR